MLQGPAQGVGSHLGIYKHYCILTVFIDCWVRNLPIKAFCIVSVPGRGRSPNSSLDLTRASKTMCANIGKKVLGKGIYVPVLTFFKDDKEQTLDIETHKLHILWMARAGVNGFVLQGSTGEAVAIKREEKIEVRNTFMSLSPPSPPFQTRSIIFTSKLIENI